MSAYNNGNNGNRQNSQSREYTGNRNQSRPYKPNPTPLPTNYIDIAQEVMDQYHGNITSSKLRNILSMVSGIYNAERMGDQELSETSQNSLRMLRVRIIYEYGRNDEDFQTFIRESHILDYLLAIGKDRQKFIDYAQYMEAIVAYHKFYGEKKCYVRKTDY